MGDAEKVLREAAEWLDLTQPVALTFMGVLGHVVDHDEARSIVAGLLDGLPSGSYLSINDSVNTSAALEEALRVYEASGAVPYRTRTPEQSPATSRAWNSSSRAWSTWTTGGRILTLLAVRRFRSWGPWAASRSE